jgi:hypothetical protein
LALFARSEQLRVCSDSMHYDRRRPDPVYEQQVSAQVTFNESGPIGSPFSEPMFVERPRKRLPRDEKVEHVLQGIPLELRMPPRLAIIAFEARKNDQLSSHRKASRPLLNRRPLPSASSFRD